MQVVSPAWDEMLRDKDVKKSKAALTAILQMTKPDMEKIRRPMRRKRLEKLVDLGAVGRLIAYVDSVMDRHQQTPTGRGMVWPPKYS
jgi:hypothetical protein